MTLADRCLDADAARMRRGVIAGILFVAVLAWWLWSGAPEPGTAGSGGRSQTMAGSPEQGAIPEGTGAAPSAAARTAIGTQVVERGRGTLRIIVTLAPEGTGLPHVTVHAFARDGRQIGRASCRERV